MQYPRVAQLLLKHYQLDKQNQKSPGSEARRRGSFQNFPWYCFLFPLFYVLHGYANYWGVVSVGTTIQIAGEYMLGTMLLLILGMLLFRSLRKAALFAFLANLANFYLGTVQDQMIFHNFLFPAAKISVLLILFFLLMTGIFYKFDASIRNTRKYITFLNLLMIVFIVIDIFNVVTVSSETTISKYEGYSLENKLIDSIDKDSLPDVYFILLDEYAGTSSLRDGMNFSNEEFLNFLRGKGFFVADSSRANYNSTLYSMASILNLTYLPVKEAKGENRSDVKPAYNSIANNQLSELLQQRGYEFYNNSWFSMRNIRQLPNSSLERAERDFITAQTVLNRFRRKGLLRASRIFGWRKVESRIMRESKVYNMELTENLERALNNPTLAAPRFIYTHFSMPHYPFYFDQNGKEYSLDSLARISDMNSSHYLEYLLYCNYRLKELIEKIIAKAIRPFVIFIVSDHGYRNMPGLDWDNRVYSSFFAVLDSRGRKFDMPNTISNVNIFRLWLNAEFGDKLASLPDSSFVVRFQE